MHLGEVGVTVKARLNLNIDSDLKDWAMEYAHRHNTTITTIICAFFRQLMDAETKSSNEELVEQI